MMNSRKEEIAKKAAVPPAPAAAKHKGPQVPMLRGAKLAMAPKVRRAPCATCCLWSKCRAACGECGDVSVGSPVERVAW